MRTTSFCVLFILCSLSLFCSCAKKEVVKSEEDVVSTVEVQPTTPLVVPELQSTAPQPAPVLPEIQQKQKVVQPNLQPTPITADSHEKETLEPIFFDFDKSDLRELDREILTKNGKLLLDKIEGKVQIEGHCDERGSAEYNLALGERRARSAMNYLVTLGVPAERLFTISYGKEKPIDPGHNENAWSKNRRDQFVGLAE